MTFEVDSVPVYTGFDECKSGGLHCEDEVVDFAGLGCETAGVADWHGTCDVRGVVVEFAAGVDEEDLWVDFGCMRFGMGVGGREGLVV